MTVALERARGTTPAHPGEVVRQLIERSGIGITESARRLGVSRGTLHSVLTPRGSVSGLMAYRLARAFRDTTPEYWLSLQQAWDLEQIRPQARRLRVRPIS